MPNTDNMYLGAFGSGYLMSGAYTLSNGSGGANIGPFRLGLIIPPPLVWTDPGAPGPIVRSQGVTLKWTGADPDEPILIMGTVGQSQPSGATTVTQFVCHARASDGGFFVPPQILLALPSSEAGSLALGAETAQTRFTATGLDLGFAALYEEIDRTVGFR
jgi:hypothetical protein